MTIERNVRMAAGIYSQIFANSGAAHGTFVFQAHLALDGQKLESVPRPEVCVWSATRTLSTGPVETVYITD